MRMLTVLVLGTTVACATLAQDDPVETRHFPAEFLLNRPGDSYGTSLALAQDAIGTRADDDSGRWGLLSSEDLVAIVKRDVAPASWAEAGHSIQSGNLELIAVNRRSVLAAVENWLTTMRARHGRRIVIDAALVIVPPERWGRIAPKDLAQGAVVLKTARLTAASGQRVVAQDLHQVSYVRDHDVQISTSAGALDPTVDVLNTGVRIDLRPFPSPGEEFVLIDVRSEAAVLEAMEDKAIKTRVTLPTSAAAGTVAQADWEGLVQLPRTTFDRIRGQIVARAGETVVAAAATRPDGILVLLLTPVFAGEPFPAANTPSRLYDVDALTAKVQDWSPPRVELIGPSRGGGGPLTGATYTLDEPRENYGTEALRDDLRAGIEPADMPIEMSAFQWTAGKALEVQGKEETHALVGKRLKEAFRREVRSVTTEAAVLAFKPAARAEWSKSVAALAPGGTRATDAELSKLLEAAGKGPDVRLAALLAVSGRPHQRVHVLSGRQQAYVQDYEPQVSTTAACYDPIIGVQLTGVGLAARPSPRAGDGSFNLQVGVWVLSAEMLEDKKVSSDAGPVQRPKVTGFNWETETVCVPDHWTLAALESRGTGAAAEEFALFVRVR